MALGENENHLGRTTIGAPSRPAQVDRGDT